MSTEQWCTPSSAVTDYLSASQNNNPNLYPGERPESSYVTDGVNIFDIAVTTEAGSLQFRVGEQGSDGDLDDFLKSRGVASMDERIPVLAYGANMSPGSLAKKFCKDLVPGEEGVAPVNNRPDLSIIPTVYGELPGHDVVWSGGPGLNGNFIAILYAGKETEHTAVQVGVNFLTREQLLMMHATELSYNLSSIEVDVNGVPLRAYYYAGVDSVYLRDGHPVAVSSIPAESRELVAATTEQLGNEMLQDDALMGALKAEYPALERVSEVQHYYDFIRTLKSVKGSQPRLRLKQMVHAAIAEQGRSKIIEDDRALKRLESWANPSTLATYGQQKAGRYHNDVYRLPSQELPKTLWANVAAREKVLRGIGAHTVRSSGGKLVELK